MIDVASEAGADAVKFQKDIDLVIKKLLETFRESPWNYFKTARD